jgi:hypothetical protein
MNHSTLKLLVRTYDEKNVVIWLFSSESHLSSTNDAYQTCIVCDMIRTKNKKPSKSWAFLNLVAGAGFEPTTFGL